MRVEECSSHLQLPFSHPHLPCLGLPAAWILGPYSSPQGKGGNPYLPTPSQHGRKRPQKELTCRRPTLKQSASAPFLCILRKLRQNEELFSRSHQEDGVGHASRRDVFRHPAPWRYPDTYVGTPMIHSLLYLPTGKRPTSLRETPRGRFALALAEPDSGDPAHSASRIPHPRTALRPRSTSLSPLRWVTSIPSAREGRVSVYRGRPGSECVRRSGAARRRRHSAAGGRALGRSADFAPGAGEPGLGLGRWAGFWGAGWDGGPGLA